MRRNKARFGLIILALTFASALAAARPLAYPKREGVVTDSALVLDDASKQRITALSDELYSKAHARIAVATIDSLNGEDIDTYSNGLFRAWGIGKKGSDRGVLIVLAVRDRKYRVEVGYGMESILPDGKVGGFGREMVPYLRQQKYGAALEGLSRNIANVIAEDAKVALSATPQPVPFASSSAPPPAASRSSTATTVIFLLMFITVPLGMFAIVAFMIYKIVTNRSLQEVALNTAASYKASHGGGSSFDSSSDSSSSSDSGSSDSGFSGGDSGGGGASGSW